MCPSATAAIVAGDTRPTIAVSTTPMIMMPTCASTTGEASRSISRSSPRVGRSWARAVISERQKHDEMARSARSFPLDRGRRLRTHVVDYAVHALYLVDDPARNASQNLVRER